MSSVWQSANLGQQERVIVALTSFCCEALSWIVLSFEWTTSHDGPLPMMDQHSWILFSPHRHFRLGLHPDSNMDATMLPGSYAAALVSRPYDAWSLFSSPSATDRSLIPIIQSPMLQKGLETMGHTVRPLRGVIVVMYSVNSGEDYILEKASNCWVVPCTL